MFPKVIYPIAKVSDEHRCPDIIYQWTSFQNITEIHLCYDYDNKSHYVYLAKFRGYAYSGIKLKGRYAIMNSDVQRIVNILNNFKFNLVLDYHPCGFDGTAYQIRIGSITECVFRWWMYCPAQWEQLATIGFIMKKCLTASRLLNANEVIESKGI